MILHFWHFYTGVIFHGNTQWWRKSQHFKESQENLAAQHHGTSSPPGGRAPTEWFSELGTAAAPDRPTPLHPHYTASCWRAERSDTCRAGDPTINVACHRFLFMPFWMNSSKNLTKLIQEILNMRFKSIKHLAFKHKRSSCTIYFSLSWICNHHQMHIVITISEDLREGYESSNGSGKISSQRSHSLGCVHSDIQVLTPAHSIDLTSTQSLSNVNNFLISS